MTRPSQPRVLVSARLQDVGGVEIHVLNLCRWLVAQGAEVTFASRFIQARARPIVEELRKSSVAVVSTPFAHQGDRWSTIWATLFWGLHLGAAFDVIYTFDTTAFARVLMGRLKRGGYLLGARAGVPRLDPTVLHPSTVSVLDGFIVETEMQAQAYRQLGMPVLAIPLMAQIESVPRRTTRPLPACLRVVFLGRLDRNKGIYRLLEFWPQAEIQPASLEIHGDGLERDQLALLVRERGLADTVELKGPWFGSKQLAEILSAADIVVLPSEDEGLPLVLLESMAWGVPFVATDVGAIRTLAEGNPDVRVVPLDNDSLRRALEDMATGIRSGAIDPVRLQNYHAERFGHEKVIALWSHALLQPRTVLGPPKNVLASRFSWLSASVKSAVRRSSL